MSFGLLEMLPLTQLSAIRGSCGISWVTILPMLVRVNHWLAMALDWLIARTAREASATPIDGEKLQKAGFDRRESAGLFVGVSEFEDPSISRLEHTVDDAVDLAHLFIFELGLLAPEGCTLALSGPPKKIGSGLRLARLKDRGVSVKLARIYEVEESLRWLGTAAGPNGLLMAAFATHGISIEGEGRLLAADSIWHKVGSSSLGLALVQETMMASKSLRRLALVDACRGAVEASRSPSDSEEISAEFSTTLGGATGMVTLLGSINGGKAYEDRKVANGVFTAAVLRGLRGAAEADARGFITARTLADYAHEQVKRWTQLHRPSSSAGIHGVAREVEGDGDDLPLAVKVKTNQPHQTSPSSRKGWWKFVVTAAFLSCGGLAWWQSQRAYTLTFEPFTSEADTTQAENFERMIQGRLICEDEGTTLRLMVPARDSSHDLDFVVRSGQVGQPEVSFSALLTDGKGNSLAKLEGTSDSLSDLAALVAAQLLAKLKDRGVIPCEIPKEAAEKNDAGIVALHAGQYHEAIPHFREAVAMAPSFADALGNLAESYAKTGRGQEAEELLLRAVALDPKNATLHVRLARYRRGGDWATRTLAAENYLQSLSLDPGNLDARYELVILYLDLEQKVKAEETLAPGLAGSQTIAKFQLARARILLENEKYKEALTALRIARSEPRAASESEGIALNRRLLTLSIYYFEGVAYAQMKNGRAACAKLREAFFESADGKVHPYYFQGLKMWNQLSCNGMPK